MGGRVALRYHCQKGSPRQGRKHGLDRFRGQFDEFDQPAPVVHSLRQQHGDGLGEGRVGRIAEKPGQGTVDAGGVDRVSHLVQKRAQGTHVGTDVRQDPNVAFVIDVGAEGVFFLADPLFQIAAPENGVGIESDGLETAPRDLHGIRTGAQAVEIRLRIGGKILEEGVEIVPGTEPIDRNREPGRAFPVDFRLEIAERPVGGFLEIVEEPEDPGRIEFGQHETPFVEIAVSLSAGRFVAQPDEFQRPVLDHAADFLARFPEEPAFLGIFRRTENVHDVVEGDGAAVDQRAMIGERGVEIRREFDHSFESFRILLPGFEGEAQQADLARHETGTFAERVVEPAKTSEGFGIGEDPFEFAAEFLDPRQMFRTPRRGQPPAFEREFLLQGGDPGFKPIDLALRGRLDGIRGIQQTSPAYCGRSSWYRPTVGWISCSKSAYDIRMLSRKTPAGKVITGSRARVSST